MPHETIGSGQGQADFAPIESLPYEHARNELIEIVKILELGQMSLDESLRYWERGEALARYCEEQLSRAASKVAEVTGQQENSQD
ncbi:exodeoxyribonuclease VII small subunit [Corynebacterium sp. ES2794-CONJ1]|uniref:exodeoxyribonuclease VII small subunit n=1 Tax=unclassified Corynebacterium TaxID=2624378 RepID=UPI00216A5797|nr:MULTISPECIES: exodeoxyribonuclease VII small subunit [unclassified Corynebacterium]MCS4489927.1 exodeoxyribonuclease VII small subunit [Corynebacterium sp. ES2775-CONJ]MCS4491710.1 exodeoxyribonuclease VII small subunit [Corynebacterium sp. ES2715-CONJ3]MCS4531815.1 exodeoxyribonuclease VII small subunit [Corynebacterium sp. ES2730-CONJ]MCU9519211.1 exodeoxyribonuclease VII small subunit [Corynebacterium sp. ES2794-CONJ1]